MKKDYCIIFSFFAFMSLSANQISESQMSFAEGYWEKGQNGMVEPEVAKVNTEKEPALKKGFVSLYNGKDLDGWEARGGHCKFEAQGEGIVGRCVPGSPSTYLSTLRNDYKDFVFTVEMKWEVDGNTGVMFRAKEKPGKKGRVTVYGPQAEMEGFAKERGWSGGIYGQSAGGWQYPLWLDAHEEVRKALRKDGWNRLTIKAVGANIKTWVNGMPAADWDTEEYLEGYFALQVHSGKEGTIHFRNIKVKEL